ncbi:MAG: hypothetical protein LBK71_03040 [Verrucomicrobiales bacterium]|jgi:hypothetical protein|nr:hypothetical protein [Verrucomicrobiales bacterium]
MNNDGARASLPARPTRAGLPAFHRALLAALLALGVSACGPRGGPLPAADGAAPVNDQTLTLSGTFAPKKLRAYGTVSGASWRDADGGSLLQINCEDEAAAKLAQAKYLSDLDTLPPGTKPGQVTVSGQAVHFRDAGEQGAVAALRQGGTVIIAAAASPSALGELLGKTLTVSGWSSSAEAKVPMWLDRFDKFGFHFYYAPGLLKPGPGKPPIISYDPAEDFAFAARHGAGLTIWTGAQYGETAEWLNNDLRWDWALREARKNGIPVGLNLELNSKIHYWIYNRDPLTLMQFAPDFLGTYYGSMNFGIGALVSWCSESGQDTLLAQVQQLVKKYRAEENISAWLEPHEEMGHGPADMLVEYGPLADANYRAYLREKYGSPSALAQRWGRDDLRAWDDVRVPEIAEFFGWGPDALDLRGEWRVSYDDADNEAALTADFNDSAWPVIVAPGHGLNRLMGTIAKQPVLWRRHFDADGGWLAARPKVFLYVWDMNDNRGARRDQDQSQRVTVTLNGKTLEEKVPLYDQDHRAAFDVTGLIKPADNVLAVRLSRGMINYRVYLSGAEPQAYPGLGAGRNAQWADYYDWMFYIREKALVRGMQMIRQADPHRGIILMSPDYYVDVIHQAARAYGGDFHNTGYMAGWWCDRLAAYMRAAGLPMSTEPGNGPPNPQQFGMFYGHWITEGVNAVDLFMNMGEIYWHPDNKRHFEEYAKVYTSIGRYHQTSARVAALYSGRVERLLGFPWLGDGRAAVNADGEPYFRGNAYVSPFNARRVFSLLDAAPPGPAYESDAVTELSFQRDQIDPAQYRVIVDTSTSFMDEATVSGIERYVRAGGIFVTYGDSGRHSLTEPDTWPLATVSGFRAQPGRYFYSDAVSVGPERAFLSADFSLGEKEIHGIHYQRVADDAQILATWKKDGSVALGLRQIGRGYVVTVGPSFGYSNEPRGNSFFGQIFQWQNIGKIPARFEADSDPKAVVWRHFVSNSGLYDVWAVYNNSKTGELRGNVVLDAPLRPAWFIDVKTGERRALSDGRLPVRLPPPTTVNVYLTPRAVSGSADEWFTLQRGWWSGADGDLGQPFPPKEQKWMVDITDGWAFKPLALTPAGEPLAEVSSAADDNGWERRPLGIFTHPDHPGAQRAVFRRAIQIPANWDNGTVGLRLPEFYGHARIYLDGQPVPDRCANIAVRAGEKHLLAVDIRSEQGRVLLGANGAAWLSFHPAPAARQDLAGDWQPTGDYINFRAPLPLPGKTEKDTRALRRVVKVSDAARGQTVVLQAVNIVGVVINGHYLRPHTKEAAPLPLNITPWVNVGADNEIILLTGGGPDNISEAALEFHEPGTYP